MIDRILFLMSERNINGIQLSSELGLKKNTVSEMEARKL